MIGTGDVDLSSFFFFFFTIIASYSYNYPELLLRRYDTACERATIPEIKWRKT